MLKTQTNMSTPNQPAPAKPEHSALIEATIKKLRTSSGWWEGDTNASEVLGEIIGDRAEMLHALKLAHELLFRHPGTPEHGTAMTAINRAIRNATK